MKALKFIEHLQSLDIRIWAEEGKLRCNAPPGVLTEELRQELARLKPEIMALLDGAGSIGTQQSPIPPIPHDGELVLSFSQQQIWLQQQLTPESVAYNIPICLMLKGHLNLSALQSSLDEIIRRHKILRTTFAERDGHPFQRIEDPFSLQLAMHDLQHLPAEQREAAAQGIIADDNNTPIDIAIGPLLRSNLITIDPEKHVLFLTIHHIIFDGWSITVFIDELAMLYTAFCNRQPSPLPELTIQYADFAHWQRNHLQGDSLQRQLDWWQNTLAGPLPPLNLPLDFPRPAIKSYNGKKLLLELSPELSESLQKLTRREGVSLFMTILTLLKALLYRQTGQTDLLVGAPIAGRNRIDIENLMGFFINTLVLRTDLSGNPTFRELLHRVKETTLDAYAHQDMPFEKLVEVLDYERELSRTPIFQVFLNHLNLNPPSFELPGLKAESFGSFEMESKFDLQFYLVDSSDKVCLLAIYNTVLFSTDRIEDLMAQFQTLIEAAVADLDSPITAPSLISPAMRPKLPDPAAPLNSDRGDTILSRFTRAAREFPTNIALTSEYGNWTYRELDEITNHLANMLVARGIQREDVVAVYTYRSAALVKALIGILKAGATFLILDQSYPPQRLVSMVAQTKPAGLLGIETMGLLPAELEAALAPHLKCKLELSEEHGLLQKYNGEQVSSTPPNIAVDPDQLAYISFTSGSTGQPKGILGTHRPVAHFLDWYISEFNLKSTDRFTMFSGIAHDPLLRDIFAPLSVGATLCVPSLIEFEVPDNLLRWMKHEGITVTHLTPALSSLLMQGFSSRLDPKTLRASAPLPALRLACFGGDSLDRHNIEIVERLAPSAECVNFYGATETPQAMGFHRCVSVESPPAASTQIPLGRGIDDVQLLVLNENGQLTGLGELGEICIRTPYLTKGYLGDDELTTRRFVLNPCTNAPGDLLYRTGDAGRYLPDGSILFAGRLDNQVSINGYRVELNEIRSVLNTIPGIQDCAVVTREDAAGNRSLVAYFVAESSFDLEIAGLAELLRRSLPVYMIPGIFVRIEAIPLTPNGKLDRNALPDPDQALGRLRKAYVAPRTDTEKAIAEIWSAVLHKDPISVRDNFFDLGGHSLIATQVISRIRSQLNIEIPLRAMFEEPTIAQLAHAIDTGHGSHSRPKAPPIVPVQRSGTDLLSFSQERMWFIQQIQPDTIAYNMSAAIHLVGPVDADLMIEAFHLLALRQESFRTWFDSIDGQPFQHVENESRITGQIIDMQTLPESQREPEAIRQAGEILQTPFDLRNDHLVKVVIFKLTPEHHIMLVCKHHIISDMWSYGILGRELNEFYLALRENREPNLPEMPVQYIDYSHWQRNWLRESVLDNQLEYWRNQLQGVQVLELPTDFTRPVARTFRGARRLARFPADWVGRIRNFSTQNNATPFMTLLSIFKLILWRYSGSDDIAVGTPIANRHRIEIENLIGTFVNTVAIRTDLSGNPTFREFLDRIRENALGAFANQDLPFERIVEEMAPVRDLSIPPLVQVLFNLGNAPLDMDNDREFTIRPVMVDRGASQFDMTMAVMLSEDLGGGILIEYDTDLFAAETIERLLRHYQNALESALTNPDLPIADLAFLSESDISRLTVEWNATEADYPRESPYHRLFENQVAATPAATAMRFNDNSITYEELNRRANQVAHFLRAQGVQPDQFVGVYFERSIDMLVALLGIMKSGAAYLPLDPAFPKDRLEYMIEDSAAPVILSTESLRGEIDTQSAVLICIDTDWPRIADLPDSNPQPVAGPDNIAYIIYTSGSTGKPKGVVIPNRALTNFLNSMAREPGLATGDSLLAVTTLSFDISGLELFLPLMTGATIILADRETAIDATRLMQTLSESNCNVMQATPATWRMMLEAGWQGDSNLKILCGGEALTPELAHKLQPICRELWNMYGPTETTIWSTIWKVEPDSSTIIIGRPIDNTTVYILDSNLKPVPIGVAGELHIGGDGLAIGYLNRPELTAEKFIPHPFASDSGQRIYKTGDLARWRPDGQIECLGRVDFQVKIRGFRIEVGEVETVLSRFPSIQKAAVVAGDDTHGVKRLLAYYTTGAAADPAVADLRSFMRKSLPEYMVPSIFVKLDTFPLTPNGKIDRKRLPDPGQGDLGDRTEYVAPRNDLEARIADIYAEVLGLEKVSVTADFFELGGHSLAATRVISRIRKQLNTELPLRKLFEEPTVRQLAQYFDDGTTPIEVVHSAPIERIQRTDDMALSFSQQRLWLLYQLDPESLAYNIPATMMLNGVLNITALERTLSEIVRRHEVLRTYFADNDGEPVQRIAKQRPVFLARYDIQSSPADKRETEAQEIITRDTNIPFDLAIGPLLRCLLITLAPDKHIFHITFHHVIFDGWSARIFVRELSSIYTSISNNEPVLLPELDIQYADFSHWQREYLSGETLKHQVEFWTNKLGGPLPTLQFPTDKPRPIVQSHRGKTIKIQFSPEVSESLHQISNREGASLFMTLLAVLNALLHRQTGQDDILVGSPIAGRNRVETENLIGFFINTLVLRTDVSGEPTFRELLARVRETTLGAYAHQDMPFEKLVEILDPERDMSRTPLFQVFFNFINIEIPAIELPELTIEAFGNIDLESKFDLTIYVTDFKGRVGLVAIYNADLFSESRMIDFLEQFKLLVETFTSNPDEIVTRPVLVSDAFKLHLPDPQIQLDGSFDGTIHQRFCQIAAQYPDNIALNGEYGNWTYRQLDHRSNQLANALIGMGVQKEDVVAVYAYRSTSLPWALLGILKAGAAFMILDHSFPIQRLVNKVDQAKPKALVSLQTVGNVPAEIKSTLAPYTDKRVIMLPELSDAAASSFDSFPTTDPGVDVHPNQLAYISFTSGSTGNPMGILGSHRPVAHFIDWYLHEFDIKPTDRFSMLSGLAHDPILRDIFAPLSVGASLHIPSPIEIELPDNLVHWMKHEAITVTHLTPAMSSLLMQSLAHIDPDEPGFDILPNLRYVFFGGDILSKSNIDNIRRLSSNAISINCYGATETPQVMGVHRYVDSEMHHLPIGKGISNVQLLVLNREGKLAGLGELGEICIRTPYLSMGYLDNRQLTASRFVPNPFTNQPGDLIYRTGDTGRYLPDASVQFCGRLDDQVSINGFRIEPAEIRIVLNRHPEIQDSVIIARETANNALSLVAYIVTGDSQPTPRALIEFLRLSLPNHMIPAAFICIDSVPLTPNGKVDRHALPDPDQSDQQLSSEYIAPRTETERQIAEIYAQVLGVEKVSMNADFFELGGHSMAATRLISMLRKKFNVDLPLRSIFQESSVANLAASIRFDEEKEGYQYIQPANVPDTLIPMQISGSKRPLFLVAGAYADEERFLRYLSHMIPHLGADQPVFGFQPRGLDGKADPHKSVEDMATYYIEQLIRLQPKGPYFICGECVGGIVAYEIARQLKVRGKEVAALILMDTPRPSPRLLSRYKSKIFFARIVKIYQKTLALFSNPRTAVSDWARAIRKYRASTLPMTEKERISQRISGVEKNYRYVLYNFRPQPYDGKLTIIVNEVQNNYDPSMGWSELAVGGLDSIVAPGNHVTRLTVFGKETAAIISSVLERAEKEINTPK